MNSDLLIRNHAHKRYHVIEIFSRYNWYKSCNLIANDNEVMASNVE